VKIPDEIVREAERAWEETPRNRFRAALQVAARWAVGECAKVAETLPYEDRWPGEDHPDRIAAAIRKLAGGDDE
jgi:hypothetical protein